MSALRDGSRRSSGSAFQAIGPATENARRPSVLHLYPAGEEVKARYVQWRGSAWCLSVNSPELFFGLFRVRVRVRIRVNSVTETNMMTEKNNSGELSDKYRRSVVEYEGSGSVRSSHQTVSLSGASKN